MPNEITGIRNNFWSMDLRLYIIDFIYLSYFSKCLKNT
jgi:hypothetical protein